MPSSFNNCGEVCPQSSMSAVPARRQEQDREVEFVLISLEQEHEITSNVITSLNKRQQIAAQACAMTIFNGDCPSFVYTQPTATSGFEILRR